MDAFSHNTRVGCLVGLLGADVESYFLEGSEMKLEVGKKYLNRDRDCVTIVSSKGCGDDRFIGILLDKDGFEIAYNYREDGSYFVSEESDHDLLSEYTEPKPPQYVPYTWEDREQLRGRWYRRKNNSGEYMIGSLVIDNETEIIIGPWRADEFLGVCEWLDGTPCGKVVE